MESSDKAHDKKDFLDANELERLEAAFRSWAGKEGARGSKLTKARMLLMFLLIRYTGSKLCEVLELDLDRDIDIVGRTVTFRGTGKRRKPRKAELSQQLADEMNLLLPLIHNKGRGFAVDPSFVRRAFYARAEECGLDPTRSGPEMVRKARAIELMRNKLPLPAVQRLYGRSTPHPALREASFTDDEMRHLTRLYLERETGGQTSARNSFFGKVRAMTRGEVQTLVEIITSDGEDLFTVITNTSVVRLALRPGMLVTAEIKAPWLTVEAAHRGGNWSADNAREGEIIAISTGAINTECVVRTPGGCELVAIQTTAGFQRLGLKPGDAVRVLFSAYAVILKTE